LASAAYKDQSDAGHQQDNAPDRFHDGTKPSDFGFFVLHDCILTRGFATSLAYIFKLQLDVRTNDYFLDIFMDFLSMW